MQNRRQTIQTLQTACGFHFKPVWIDALLDEYKSLATEDLILQKVFMNDLSLTSLPVLPAQASDLHNSRLTGQYVLQVQEMMNVGEPVEKRDELLNAKHRVFRFRFTDGHQSMEAMEYQRLEELTSLLPPGSKVLVSNVEIMRGWMLLTNASFSLLYINDQPMNRALDLSAEITAPSAPRRRRDPVGTDNVPANPRDNRSLNPSAVASSSSSYLNTSSGMINPVLPNSSITSRISPNSSRRPFMQNAAPVENSFTRQTNARTLTSRAQQDMAVMLSPESPIDPAIRDLFVEESSTEVHSDRMDVQEAMDEDHRMMQDHHELVDVVSTATDTDAVNPRKLPEFAYLSQIHELLHQLHQHGGSLIACQQYLIKGWVKSVSSFDCSAGYCLVVIIEDGTRALQVKVNPKLVQCIVKVSSEEFHHMIRQKSTQAETLAKFLQRHLQSMEGLMTLDIGGTKGNMAILQECVPITAEFISIMAQPPMSTTL